MILSQPVEMDPADPGDHFTLDKGLNQLKKAYSNLRGNGPREDGGSGDGGSEAVAQVTGVMKKLSDTLLAVRRHNDGESFEIDAFRILVCFFIKQTLTNVLTLCENCSPFIYPRW